MDKDIFTVFSYQDGTIKKAIRSLKYAHNKPIAKVLARILYDFMLEEIYDLNTFWQSDTMEKPLLIPTPISNKRLKERGYNQVELITKELSFIDNAQSFIEKTNVLYKIEDTPSQVSIRDRKKRLVNLSECFDVRNKESIKKRNIILVDDITTTGATLKEASSALLKAGANKILCFTIAH